MPSFCPTLAMPLAFPIAILTPRRLCRFLRMAGLRPFVFFKRPELRVEHVRCPVITLPVALSLVYDGQTILPALH